MSVNVVAQGDARPQKSYHRVYGRGLSWHSSVQGEVGGTSVYRRDADGVENLRSMRVKMTYVFAIPVARMSAPRISRRMRGNGCGGGPSRTEPSASENRPPWQRHSRAFSPGR